MHIAIPATRMPQVQAPPSQLQVKSCMGPEDVLQPQGTRPPASHEGVPGSQDPYGRAVSILGYWSTGHAEFPQAAEQVVVAAGVPLGRNEKTDVGP